ncbi:MAG: leucine-rich repeat protein [Eubacteriales bacterium]|nr:leucine-rich repeat protein [Eubacteriales bacterium]
MKRISIIFLAVILVVTTLPIFSVSADAVPVLVAADESWNNATYNPTTNELRNIDGGYSFIMTTSGLNATLGVFDTINGITVSRVVLPYQITYNEVTYEVTAQEQYLLAPSSTHINTTVTDLILSEGIATVSTQAFRQLGSGSVLKNVHLPSTMKTISANAFAGCSKLTDINIPEGVTTIGNQAFDGCSSLVSITLPSTLTTIGNAVFKFNTSLKNIVYTAKSLPSEIFRGCTSLTSFIISDYVTGALGPSAFNNTRLTELVLPAGITSIGKQSISSISTLTSVTCKGNITSIAAQAFEQDKALKSLTFEGTVAPTIANINAFTNVTGLTVFYHATGTGYDNSTWRAMFPVDTVFQMKSSVPVASGLTITGKNLVGSTLQGSYNTYFDPMGNPESGSTATWSRADDKAFTTNVQDIITVPISQGAVSNYTLTQADNGKYIKFSVIPRSAAQESNEGEEVSETLNDQIRMPQTLPIVTLTSPYPNYRVHEQTDIALSAVAVCDNTTITRIEYYANDALIAQSSSYPYNAVWSDTEPGDYTIYARAYNALGEYGDCATVSIKVYSISESLDPVWAKKWSYDFNQFTSTDIYTSSLTLPGTKPPTINFQTGGTVQSAHGIFEKDTNDYQLQINSITGGTETPQLYYPLSDLDSPIKNAVAEAEIAFTTNNETHYPLKYRTPRTAYNTFIFSNTGKIGYHTTPSQWTAFKDDNGNDLTYSANEWYRLAVKLDFENCTISYYIDGVNILTMTPPDPDYFTSVTQWGFTGNHGSGTQFGVTYLDNLILSQEQPSYVTSVLSAPVGGSYQLSGSAVQFTGYAKDARGKAIHNVELYANGVIIADKTGSSYSFTKTDLAPGHYDIYAKAISEDGMVGYSEVNSINVSGVSFPKMIADNMLIQRNKEISLSGTGVNGITVTAELNGATASATVSGGKWKIILPPQPTTKSTILKFTTSEGVEIPFNNVAIGELILCSGQSNMGYTLDKFSNLKGEADQNYPDIRLYNSGWSTATPVGELAFSAVGFLTGKGYYLSQNGNVPVGLIFAAVGGTGITSWSPPASYDYDPDLKPLKNGSDYNSQIAPWTGFTIGTVLWYQGEANTQLSTQYEKLLTAYIDGYREAWNDSSINFIIVQLPAYDYAKSFGGVRSAIGVREGQFNVSQRLDRVATVITIDTGDANNIHPADKMPIADRCVLALQHFTDPQNTDIIWKSPSYSNYEQQGSTMTIYFKDVAGGLETTDGLAPRGFRIAGDNGIFVGTSATLIGNTIVIDTSSVVGTPKVRYAWQDVPAQTGNDSGVNLVSSTGLPMAPFRTDNDIFQFKTKNADGTYSNPVYFAPTVRSISAGIVISGVARITVSARDYDESIQKVEIYADSQLLGEATLVQGTANYIYDWVNPTVGMHTLSAIATDTHGVTSTKSDITVGTTTVSPKPYTVNIAAETAQFSILPFENLSGQEIDTFEGQDGVKAKAVLPENAVFIIAAYNDKILLNTKIADGNFEVFTSDELTNATEIKAFLLNDANLIKPLTESTKIYKTR